MSSDSVEYQWEWLDDEKNGVNIYHFKVPHNIRNQGYGTQVLSELLDKFREKEAEYVVINMKGGEQAIKFLQTFDFEILEEKTDGHITAEYELQS